jgi:hypothetical protein
MDCRWKTDLLKPGKYGKKQEKPVNLNTIQIHHHPFKL